MGHVSRVYIGKLHTESQKTTYPLFKDMPVFWHKDWKEHLVGLVAHELWHRWQPGHGKKAEIMCELVESDAIDTYRKEQGYVFVPPDQHICKGCTNTVTAEDDKIWNGFCNECNETGRNFDEPKLTELIAV